MLTSLVDILGAARQQQKAVGAFTCYNFEAAISVLQAAQELQSGTIVLIGEKSFLSAQGPYLVAGLRALAERAPTPVCLQLDHVSDLKLIEAAFKLGVGAVMADGSRLRYEDNVQFVRQAVLLARHYGGQVEAELGRVEGNEDIVIANGKGGNTGALTDPEQAAHFVEQTEIACLAVSIGNVHGIYTRPPALDWARLQSIRRQVPVPLALHGASGLSDQDLRHTIELGILKVNVNTELRRSYLDAIGEQYAQVLPGLDVLKLQSSTIDAMKQVALAKMQVY